MAETDKKTNRTGGRKSSSARRSYSRKKTRDIPRWLHILIAATVTGVLLFIAYFLVLKNSLSPFAVCDGIKAYRTCLPKGYTIFGIDVSRHQGEIDWQQLKEDNLPEAPIRFAYIKATEGRDHKDPRYDSNWQASKQNGFIRGAYHYFTEASSGDAQAGMFTNVVVLEKGDLPPMIDIEAIPANEDTYKTELKKFILRLEEHYGVKPILYSYPKFHRRYLDEAFFKAYDLWIAHYRVEKPDIERDWIMWQYTDAGRIPGIEKNTDINALNGGIAELEGLLIK